MTPRVILGLPLYNGEDHLAESLEALIGQTFADFRLLMVDDSSADASAAIAAKYCTLDARLRYEANEVRIGMTRNWKRCFDRGRELWGDSTYFAWVSDHDVCHPRWLAALVRELDRVEGAVLSYPLSVGISDDGIEVREPWTFETRGMTDPFERLREAIRGMVAGTMIYGLFRADALASCGAFRSILLPDRQVLTQISLYGRFAQVPEILWFRRYKRGVKASLDRQRSAFWPDGPPFSASVWWPLSHTAAMATSLSRDRRPHGLRRSEVIGVAFTHLALSARHDLRSRWRKRWRPLLRKLRLSRHEFEERSVTKLEQTPVLGRTSPAVKAALRTAHSTGLKGRTVKARGELVMADGRRVLMGVPEEPKRTRAARKELERLSRYKHPPYLAARGARGER